VASLDRLTDVSCRRTGWVLLLGLAAAVAATIFGAPVVDILKDRSDFEDPASESVSARTAIESATGVTPDVGLIAVVRTPAGVDSPRTDRRLAQIEAAVRADPDVGSVTGYRSTRDLAFVSRDGRSTYLVASFRSGLELDDDDVAARVARRLERFDEVVPGGRPLAGDEIADRVTTDLKHAEMIAFPLVFLLSLWLFRGLLPALLPPLIGAITIVGSLLALRAANAVSPLSIYALNLVVGLGLGLAIDYSLFMLWRYREELTRHGHGREALLRTLRSAGRAVLFSAVTVAAALASLLVFPQRFLYSMGIGGALAALIAAAVALLILPALLHVLGPRLAAASPKAVAAPTAPTRWGRLAREVTGRPRLAAVAAMAILLALAVPATRVEFTGVDARLLPPDAKSHQASELLERDFIAARSAPIYVALRGGLDARPDMRRYATALRGVDGVAEVSDPRHAGRDVWRLDVVVDAPPLSDAAQEAVRDVRAVPVSRPAQIGGQAAGFVDQQRSLADHLPVALVILALTSFTVLFRLTGSVVLPVKALLTNLLSAAAALGVLVLVFQDGRLTGLLDYTSRGALDATQPVLLFALAFALSTDYGVFLLARVKEAHDAGHSDRVAITIGLTRTGRSITGAALLFCVAIGAVATSQVVFIKELGVGTAAAVIIDATIIRVLLVPATMMLLGRANWWAPRLLRRFAAPAATRGEAARPDA
jgi:uncharacterized membrane protein YdfJ with MMPL/SSD domain